MESRRGLGSFVFVIREVCTRPSGVLAAPQARDSSESIVGREGAA